jgi:hypothetical protein
MQVIGKSPQELTQYYTKIVSDNEMVSEDLRSTAYQ